MKKTTSLKSWASAEESKNLLLFAPEWFIIKERLTREGGGLILYHGSNVLVVQPQLVRQNRLLDFGFGFYTTTNRVQAVSFAEKVVRRRDGQRVVSIYEFDEAKALAGLDVLRFEAATAEWLDFVAANRSGTYAGRQYDLIWGAVANDDVYETFTLYTAGAYTKEAALQALKIKKLYDQVVFATERALAHLRFVEAIDFEKGE